MPSVEQIEVDEIMEKIKIGKKTYICYDMTYGFLLDVESGLISSTKSAIIANATDLTEDEVRELRIGTVDKIYAVISRLTYPHLYDEDGKLKEELPDVDDTVDKKKL